MGRFHRLAIKDHRPWRAATRFLLALILISLVAAAVYWRELGEALGALAESKMERQALVQRVEALADENARLKAQLAIQERQAQVRTEAYRRVEANLADKGRQIGELRDEVQFYRGIFSQSLKDETLGLHGLKFRALGGEGTYAYRLVLTHMGKGDNVVKGSVELAVRGERDGVPEVLTAAQLGSGGETSFSLKHFKQLDGDITLPDGFVANHVDIAIRAGNKDRIRVDQSYAWSEILD